MQAGPIAIIPAKALSTRCPGKNLRLLGGLPLFMHSVFYAAAEGFSPVVSTDSERVMEICRNQGIQFVEETVDDRHMGNCARQVIERFRSEIFAILQPTSPFREAGLLRRMHDDLELHGLSSAFTAQKIKMIGILDGRFHIENRQQDAKRFFRFFDGNLLLRRTEDFLRTGEFFDDDSRPYENRIPCCLQIDTEEEFALLGHLAESAGFRCYLHGAPRPRRRICVVSNKCDLSRDYSRFVDSCDVVMRISKMDNLDTGLTGKRTDVVLVSCFWGYLEFTREARHVDELKRVPEIYFVNDTRFDTERFVRREGIQNWRYLPDLVHLNTPFYTTLSKGIALADYLYPDDVIYYLGDCRAEARAFPGSHPFGKENQYLRRLIDSGRVVPILEEEAAGSVIYSEDAGFGTRWKSRELCLFYGSECELDAVVEAKHPHWCDRIRILGDRARRRKSGDGAKVLAFGEGLLRLKWDNWGEEQFAVGQKGVYEHVP